ncbi:MAG: prolipoprotein diacylglyceryl transferase [bacterium]
MYPELFGFIKSYGLMLDISFIVGIYLCVRRGRAIGLATDTIINFCFAVLVSSLIGVRLFFVLTHLSEFKTWYRIFTIWDGGLSLYGGIILATLTVWWFCRRRGIPFLQMADLMAPSVALGIGISRIGCFLSGCCFGLPTDLPWGVQFPVESAAVHACGLQAIHPAQLYSSASGFLIFGLLLWTERRQPFLGATFCRFLILYGLARFLLEFLRYCEPGQASLLGLHDSQGISLGLVVLGAVLWGLLRVRSRNSEQ